MVDGHEVVASYLRDRLTKSATGESEDLIVDNRPRNVLFAGCLAPRVDAAVDNLESAEDFYARLAPSAIEVSFLVPAVAELRLKIAPRFHVYYRVAPSFPVQRRRTRVDPSGLPLSEQLVRSFRKHVPLIHDVFVTHTNAEPRSDSLSQVVNDSVASAVAAEPAALGFRDKWTVPAAALGDEATLRDWCARTRPDIRPPKFDIEIISRVSKWALAGFNQVTVSLVNRSAIHADYDKADYWEQTVFNCSLDIELLSDGIEIKPYTFVALPNSYRFDRDQWGTGINCVTAVSSSKRRISSKAVATYTQPRLEHRRISGADLTFIGLSADPLPKLRFVARAMKEFLDSSWRTKRDELSVLSPNHVFRSEFARDEEDFKREISEFERGVELLANEKFAYLRRAFCLANEAFAASAKSDSWRLFQLVFIVRNLAALAAREWPEVEASQDVEVLWFPTGGGKTEAFLGLLTTALFFDRLRSRSVGVTGFVRLPLRLLSHQQFQRIVRIVAAADRVRRDKIGGKQFSVGYWIGQGGSPNKIDLDTGADWARSPDKCQKWRKVEKCPYCEAPVRLRFDTQRWALLHHCESDSCGVKGDLPLYIVDDELYRFLPSVVVGTVDKLAAFGFQQRFSNLLGWVVKRCPQHGFSPRNECLVPKCVAELADSSLKDPVPSLHIQDELHLLKEDLGAFDSHYETAVLETQRLIPLGRPWKIIAATATIEQYEWQARHLYCKDATRFPSAGPDWRETFYSTTTNETNRLFLGVLPFNRSHINSMISVLAVFHSEIRELRRRYHNDPRNTLLTVGLSATTSDAAFEQILRDYEVSLTYVLTRKAGDQMAESLATQVAGYLRDQEEAPLSIRSLTGQSTNLEIEEILDAIQRNAVRSPAVAATVDAVVATSMISHGVDVDRFNFIAFFGMPRLTAEYIQASSRVGRKFPGLAVVVFSPARERDRSHFHLHEKYHEYLERLVEPPAINRWAKLAIKHTLPGLFVGNLINIIGRRLGRKLYLERELYSALYSDRVLSVDGLSDDVVRLYAPDDSVRERVREQVVRSIERFVNGLRRNANRTLWQQSDFRPMLSLRDVEEPIYFSASRYSAEAFQVWMQSRRKSQLRETEIE